MKPSHEHLAAMAAKYTRRAAVLQQRNDTQSLARAAECIRVAAEYSLAAEVYRMEATRGK